MKLKAELGEFAAAVAEGRQPAITAANGRKVLAVLDAVRASAASGQPVAMAAA
jgi:predicted dehydrogenase